MASKYKNPKKVLVTFPSKTLKRIEQIAKCWGMPRNQVIVMVMTGFAQGANDAGVAELLDDLIGLKERSKSA